MGYNSFILQSYYTPFCRSDFYQMMSTTKYLQVGGEAHITITDFGPNHVCCEIDQPVATRVTLGQMFFKGWQTRIDGREAVGADDQDHFVSCSVSAGHHSIEFLFDRPEIIVLFMTTVLMTFIFLVTLIWSFSQRKKAESLLR